jgi:hypothetical protein
VTADVWNRQHDLRVKLIAKIDWWLPHGIVTHTLRMLIQKSSPNWVTGEREIIFENWVAADSWNRQRTLIQDWRMKSIKKTESPLTHGIAS